MREFFTPFGVRGLEPEAQKQPRTIREKLEKDKTVDVIFEQPEVRSYTTLEYEMSEHDGHELAPGRRLIFIVPAEFRNRVVRDVTLRHRKSEKGRELIGADRHDPHGAYSRVEIHDPHTDAWRGWRDPKGYSPDKFAEPRPASDAENEVLHDWVATVGQMNADAIRITNVGEHPEYSRSRVHGVEVVFFPELEGVRFSERIYCQGTKFIDLAEEKVLPKYGGGSHTEGQYIGAIALNQSGEALYQLGEDPGLDARVEHSRLFVALEAGKTLVQVEVAVGDTQHLQTVSTKTGRRTRLGYAKLWVGIRRGKADRVDWFIENANVPPQGMIAGGPHIEQAQIEQGDELVVESRADASYIMGWRIAYKDVG